MTLLRLIALLLLAPPVTAAVAGAAAGAPPPPTPPPPLMPPPPLGRPRSLIPPIPSPDPRLEAAIRTRLFDAARGPAGRQPVDPDSTEWEQARAQGERPSCAAVGPMRYLHTGVDLDGDARLEALALVVGSFACGSRGCTLLIFRSTAGGLELVSEMGLFQSPLMVVSRRHGGWLDLAMPGGLDGAASAVVELHFNGTTYRPSPGQAPADLAAGPAEGTVVLQMDPVPFELLGLPLPCGT